ncbi:MAG: transposase [Clostridiales bacterium]|nr:transposase [Clostridiales bacterium]MCF8022454.1 transposase [Clostridiales bacterium]
MSGKKYDKQLKEEAVRMVVDRQRSVVKVASEIGVNKATLYKWVDQYKRDKEHAFPGSGNLKPEDEEIRRIKKENADLREENEILKKAAAIFTKHRK